ncbi:hypothetical protein SZN_03879 [Streptomyces zinciresistens K42]|uniref:Lysine N-acyltransferase MbtK n=1 Tax=Streptomyces zinciresistens K42 TaxID=700597 RepID=G2G5M2_9ACTN|nr:GNAT family N-acetyltransferase [Streptomyces zinciresistens]EGX61189.1 hypothetical protein SZN_03879 [Streptomyces zinciresistens K42]
MPPTDASANADTSPATDIGTEPGAGRGDGRTPPASPPAAPRGASKAVEDTDPDSEDTLDLELPPEFVALFADDSTDGTERTDSTDRTESTDRADHAEREGDKCAVPGSARPTPLTDDLLDHLADWGPTRTPAGLLHLVPVHVERDLRIISRWMNDPAIAAFWELAGPSNATEEHLRSHLGGDGRSVPCVGLLDGTPMSYWEVYRADLDPLARYYAARPHDTGVHLLIGAAGDRGRGLGTALLRAVADLVLDKRPACARVVAEPDLRNTPSVAAFLGAGFRFSEEVELPAKRAAFMVRDRTLRHLM